MTYGLMQAAQTPLGGSSPANAQSADLDGLTEPGFDGSGTWVVMPTYNEAENLSAIATAVLRVLPHATLLVVDDGSPDGTGLLADRLAATDSRVLVRHRRAKQGLGSAYFESRAFLRRSR